MSWLFIDTHRAGAFRLGSIARGTMDLRTYEGRARDLLVRFARLRKTRASWEGVVVVAGPGTFSSIRTGVLYANLLSTCLCLPLVGVSVEEASDEARLRACLFDGKRHASASYVAPIYDAEPNITIPRAA